MLILKIIKTDIAEELIPSFKNFKLLISMLEHYNPEVPVTFMVNVLATSDSFKEFSIVYEEYGKKSISNIMTQDPQRRKNPEFLVRICYETVRGLKVLSTYNLPHKGIHPSNIFEKNGVFKLGLPKIRYNSKDRVIFKSNKYFY